MRNRALKPRSVRNAQRAQKPRTIRYSNGESEGHIALPMMTATTTTTTSRPKHRSMRSVFPSLRVISGENAYVRVLVDFSEPLGIDDDNDG
jgi:hypothetical protein